jgi:PqqD family protein of HPr-rel-A system
MDSKKPLKKNGVMSRKVSDEWVLYDQGDKSVHVLNTTAEFVWRMCDGSLTLPEIEDRMREAFDVPEGTEVKKALDNILQNFSNLGIIKFI